MSGNSKVQQIPANLVFGDDVVWDDFSVAVNVAKQGQSDKPDFDFTELGLLMPQNDATEIVYFVAQMSHAKKLDSQIRLHCHFIQSEATLPTFKLDYRFYNNGEDVPASWTTISTADGNKGVFTHTGNDMLQIASFPPIDAPLDEGLSANLDVRFYRDDNDVTGDVLLKYIDFHFQKNSGGSRQELEK